MEQEFFLDVQTNANGIYLNQQQIDLLTIVDLSSKEDIRRYIEESCTQFPGKLAQEVIPDFETLDVESCKRRLYQEYQDSTIDYLEEERLTASEKAKLKLERLNLDEASKQALLSLVENGKMSEAFQYLDQLGKDTILHYLEGNDVEQVTSNLRRLGINESDREVLLAFAGNGQMAEARQHLETMSENTSIAYVRMFNHLMRCDSENVKSVGYEEMVALNERIKTDPSIDTIIVATGKYHNCMLSNGKKTYFDPIFMEKGLEYCKASGKHMRYHALFDYTHVMDMVAQGRNQNDHDAIIREMTQFVEASFGFIHSHNEKMPDGTMRINTVEAFNELVEYNKPLNDRGHYEMAWQKHFGISLEEIMGCFKNVTKPDGVSFMYNETMLEESPVRLAEVKKVYATMVLTHPELIDRFGNQMHLEHLHGEPKGVNNPRGIEEVEQSLQLMSEIQNGFSVMNQTGQTLEVAPRPIEITEFDIHITQDTMTDKFVPALQSGAITDEQVVQAKHQWMKNVSELANQKGLKFDRVTYWSTVDTVDHNLCRANRNIQKNGCQKPYIEHMYAGLFGSGKSKKKQVGFDQRSEAEVQVATQIREKNRVIAEQKQALKKQNAGPVKKLVKPNTPYQKNGGYVSVLILSLIVSFVAGMLFMMMYLVIS